MEAARGGYVEAGRVLLSKGANVNASPIPLSKDTALTIAAYKGHSGFVELLLNKGAHVDSKNKNGCTALWLAAVRGNLFIVKMLQRNYADMDSCDCQNVSCLMAAYHGGHVHVVNFLVLYATKFPSDYEITKYMALVEGDNPQLYNNCKECFKIIKVARANEHLKAEVNARNLLKELDKEERTAKYKQKAAAKKREKKKMKRIARKMYKEDDEENQDHKSVEENENEDVETGKRYFIFC